MAMASLVVFFTSCSENEVEKPVEDTERIDRLRSELRELVQLVYGEQADNGYLEERNEEYEETVAWYEEQIAELQSLYDRDVNYQVIVVDFQGNPIAGASVTLNQNGAIATVAANANGVATFEQVRAGFITAVVKATGFATANYSTTLADLNSIESNTRVPLLPKSGAQAEASMFTVTGNLYANLSVANDSAGGIWSMPGWGTSTIDSWKGVGDTKVAGPNADYPHRTYNKMTDKKLWFRPMVDIDQIPFSGNDAGEILNIAYEDAAYAATFNATTGMYSVKLPVQSIYDGITFSFAVNAEEFAVNQTRIVNDDAFADGAPYTVDNPTPKTYEVFSNFKFNQNGYSANGRFAGSTYTFDLYYNEGYYN